MGGEGEVSPRSQLEEETLRNRCGSDRSLEAKGEGDVRAGMGAGTREGRTEGAVGEMED